MAQSPNGMTAPSQAGAVACTILLAADDWNPYELLDVARLYVENASGLEAGDELFIERIRECLRQQKRTQDSTPPAAVPVEALEGLVADMKTAANGTSDHYEARWLRLFARRLTTLIKERSNGR